MLLLNPFRRAVSAVIDDASPTGIGAVLERNARPVIPILRWLRKAEMEYSQTQREALGAYWTLGRLNKFLQGVKFTVVTDHPAPKAWIVLHNLWQNSQCQWFNDGVLH